MTELESYVRYNLVGDKAKLDALIEEVRADERATNNFKFKTDEEEQELIRAYSEGYEAGRADAIDEVPKWHLCGEDLPSVSDTYIVACIKGKGLICTSFATFQSKYKKWNLTGTRAYWKVIAWMEMPKFERCDKGAKQ